MLVLLPPSEGKTRPGTRRSPVDLPRLGWPELTAAREQVLDALAAASAGPDALDVLGVGASLADDVAANTRLRSAPAAPAGEVYSGVLYDALGLASLTATARRRANRRLVVVSALWGAVRMTDRIPAYRLAMGVSLPGVGPLATFWRPRLDQPLAAAAGRGLVVDCRSSTYQAAWTPPAGLARRTVAVRVLSEVDGRRTVVSHMAKHTRGLVTRHLLERDDEPRSAAALASAVGEAFRCELVAPPRPGRPWTLDVVVEG
ncbi:peroxide stress protein YaaA [Angustibacter peucedani]